MLYTGNYHATLINGGIHMVTDVFVGNNFSLKIPRTVFSVQIPPQHHQERIIS